VLCAPNQLLRYKANSCCLSTSPFPSFCKSTKLAAH
jgi:hypothetical protein